MNELDSHSFAIVWGREKTPCRLTSTTAHMLSLILFFYFNSNVILIVLHAIDTFVALQRALFFFLRV